VSDLRPLSDLKPSARRVLYALRAAGKKGATTGDLCSPEVGGKGFSGRVLELREAGCVVFRVQIRPGWWRYWLQKDVFEPQVTRVRAHDTAEPQLDLTDVAA
jgi:hypothetical protein